MLTIDPRDVITGELRPNCESIRIPERVERTFRSTGVRRNHMCAVAIKLDRRFKRASRVITRDIGDC